MSILGFDTAENHLYDPIW